MICVDIEKIYRERNIPNKYMLTLVLAERARMLSERYGTGLGYDEKFVTRAMNEVLNGEVTYKATKIGTEKSDGAEDE